MTGWTSSRDFPTTAGSYDTTFNGEVDTFISKLNAAGSALIYSSFLGGTSAEIGNGLAMDSEGNAYVAGYTVSADFPTTPGAHDTTLATQDAFVTKLNATGSALVYSTFLGGAIGEVGDDIAVDTGGNAYITGLTSSSDFPTTPGAYDRTYNGGTDAFLTELDTGGSSLVYSTFLGGANFDWGLGVSVDREGDAYVTGSTNSVDFPTTAGSHSTTYGGGFFDAFVTKIGEADTMPPSVDCSVSPSLLWPPNRSLVNVGVGISVSDDRDPAPTLRVLVFANDGADSSDVAEIATDTLRLRAERTGGGNGRVYLVVVTATDSAGNLGLDVCTVVVPHDESRRAIAAVNAEAEAAAEFYRAAQTAPPGYSLIGGGP